MVSNERRNEKVIDESERLAISRTPLRTGSRDRCIAQERVGFFVVTYVHCVSCPLVDVLRNTPQQYTDTDNSTTPHRPSLSPPSSKRESISGRSEVRRVRGGAEALALCTAIPQEKAV